MNIRALRAVSVVSFCVGTAMLGACSDADVSTTDDVQQRQAKAEAVAGIVATNRKMSLDNHHDHMAAATGFTTPASLKLLTPPAPLYASRFDGQYQAIGQRQGRLVTNADRNTTLIAGTPVRNNGNCVLDFATPNLMTYENSGTTYWADRTYVPWLRDCGGGSRLDLRWSKYGHMHVGFTNPDVEFCPTEPAFSPAIIDEDGNCDLFDINMMERSYVSSHGWDEVLILRANYQYDYTWVAFDLKRIRVVREDGARVCYRKASEPESEGPWIIGNGGGTGTSAATAGGWYCWPHLGQGHWDLSAWADDVIAVKITGSARSPATFSIDDIHAVVH